MENISITPAQLVELLKLVKNNEISGNTGKEVLKEMFSTGKNPGDIVKEKGLAQMSDTGNWKPLLKKSLRPIPNQLRILVPAMKKAYGFLTGQVMKAKLRKKPMPRSPTKLFELS